MKRNIKKASTLLELTICLALVSIMSVLAISFCGIIKNFTKASTGDDNNLNDFDNIRLIFETWVTQFDSTEYGFIEVDNSSRLRAVKLDSPSTNYSLAYLASEKTFVGYYPKEDDVYAKTYLFGTTETITDLSFRIFSSSTVTNHRALIECSFKYVKTATNGNTQNEKSFLFLKSTNVAGKYTNVV